MEKAFRPMERRMPARPSAVLAGVIVAFAIAAIPVAAVLAQTSGPFTLRETGQQFENLQQAVNAIGAGQGTIAIAPGTYHECAVQTAGSVHYDAVTAGTVTFARTTCEGKAALVLRGRSAAVSGIIFKNMAVPDFNGAGIRLEQGNLDISQSWFADSQQGILSGNDSNGRITIDKVTFSGLGTCEGPGGCAHSIYIGDYGTVQITRSRFEKGRGGHYVKARARTVDITASSFDDSGGRATNYMIDLPAGAAGTITGNWFVQGQDKENYSAFIAVGAEQRLHSSDGLAISGNDARLAAGVSRSTTFVADWSGDALVLGPNMLGRGLIPFDRR